MNVIDFVKQTPWAILPEMLDEIHRILAVRIHEGKLSLEELEARAGKKLNHADQPYMEGRIKVIPVYGIIAKRMNLFTAISGGVSTEILQRDIAEALSDSAVDGMVLDNESPGGTTDGPFEASDFIYQARQIKPIVAFANGLMASSAYLISSAAKIIISTQAAQVGSLGIIAAHYDYSKKDEKIGVKRTFITSGKYKATGNDSQPLSPDEEAYIQEKVDYLYTMLVNTVARNKGAAVEEILERTGDAQTFIGQQAKDVGLVDRIGTLDDAIEEARSLSENANNNKTIFTLGGMPPGKETIMSGKDQIVPTTPEQLAAMYPDLVAQIREQGAESVKVDELISTAKTEEKDRILGLAAVQIGAEEGEKFKSVVDSGVTVDQFTAIRAVDPPKTEDTTKKEMLKAINDAGAENVGAGGANTGTKDFMALVDDYQVERKCGKVDAMQAIMKKNPEAHKTYIENSQTVH